MSERIDAEIKKTVCEGAGEPRGEVRARAMEAMAIVRPTRGLSRRLVIAAVGVAALVGLGFVPIPIGKAPGALERAMAAAEQAATVHIFTRIWTDEGETVRDEWLSEQGLRRWENWDDGELTWLQLAVGPWEVMYTPGQNGRTAAAEEIYDPCYLHPADMPDRAEFEGRFEWLRQVAQLFGRPQPEVQLREYREASLWGATVDVVEAELTTQKDQPFCFGGPYDEGTQILVVAEMDPATSRLFSVREYKLEGRRWQQTYEATYEWDVEIPDDLRQFELPAGTKLTRHTWWENRAEQALAQADTRDWTVTLHAIDINLSGDVVLSLSRVETPDSEMPSVYNSAPPLVVEAVGSAGEQYSQDNRFGCYNARHSGYWTTTLKPAKPNSYPRSITLTIWPYPESPSEDQSVTFYNIPLPPRQNVDDLFAAETEVIQY